MDYRNTRTGVVISVNSEISGEWEPVTAPEPEPKKQTKPRTTKKPKEEA